MRATQTAAALTGAVVIATAAIVISGARDGGHELAATMASSHFLIKGSDVRLAGRNVGEVTSVVATRAGRAKVRFRIDGDAWPVPRGTTVQVRMGSTVAYSGRWIDLAYPKRPADESMPDGSAFASRDIKPAVEFDELFSAFDGVTRTNLSSTVDQSGQALGEARRPLSRSLDVAPAALAAVNGVLDEAGGDTQVLSRLIRSTDRVTSAILRARPGVADLLDGTARTFGAINAQSAELRTSLRALPEALGATRTTLRHANTTLAQAAELTDRLEPGIAQVRAIAPGLARALDTVRDVGPDLTHTLAAAGRAAPPLTGALDRARPLLPQVRSVAAEAARQLECVRPYTPEIAGLASTWAGFNGNADKKDKYARIQVESLLVPNATPLSSAQLQNVLPGVRVSFPRPPGENAGQPWFIEECGVGRGVNSAANDYESAPAAAPARSGKR